MHCIETWGNEFRPNYQKLSQLRAYTGFDLPFISCSATISSHTFDVVWKALSYGHCPFWGIDAGCARSDLTYVIKPIKDGLGIADQFIQYLPNLHDGSVREDIPKMIFYLPSKSSCRKTVQKIRQYLPEHLRDAVYPFTAILSAAAKTTIWSCFGPGTIRILCATEAAGMGCNVSDIDLAVVYGAGLTSLSVLTQRWGRAAQKRGMTGRCELLMPDWAFAPLDVGVEALDRLKGNANVKSKQGGVVLVQKREKLQNAFLGVINDCSRTLSQISH